MMSMRGPSTVSSRVSCVSALVVALLAMPKNPLFRPTLTNHRRPSRLPLARSPALPEAGAADALDRIRRRKVPLGVLRRFGPDRRLDAALQGLPVLFVHILGYTPPHTLDLPLGVEFPQASNSLVPPLTRDLDRRLGAGERGLIGHGAADHAVEGIAMAQAGELAFQFPGVKVRLARGDV